MGIVYVLTNPAFPDYVKVGKTANLERRLRELDTTGVPLPFRCVYAVEVEDEALVERLVHHVFADHLTRRKWEFFEIDPQCAKAALKLTGGRDVTPRDDVGNDDEDRQALERAVQRMPTGKFDDAGLSNGDVIHYVDDPEITAVVVDAGRNKVSFRGRTTSLTGAAREILHEAGFMWRSVPGWNYWIFEGETIDERRKRLLSRNFEDGQEDTDE